MYLMVRAGHINSSKLRKIVLQQSRKDAIL